GAVSELTDPIGCESADKQVLQVSPAIPLLSHPLGTPWKAGWDTSPCGWWQRWDPHSQTFPGAPCAGARDIFPLPYPHPSLQSLSTTLWIVSSGISAALSTLCGILGDLLAASSINGHRLVRTAALAPGEVQRVLLWAVAALLGSWVLTRLRGLLLPLLRGLKLFFFLGAFLHVAASQESPTVQAGMLLGLWLLYTFLGSLVASPDPSARLDAAVKSLEWKVEELRRRQKFGGPRNRED
uniref:Transmembrane protein 109 n=1 Tax=Zonotrichia albicollis TaxID=44394 RepID=A0A8D2M9H9_ZONAL